MPVAPWEPVSSLSERESRAGSFPEFSVRSNSPPYVGISADPVVPGRGPRNHAAGPSPRSRAFVPPGPLPARRRGKILFVHAVFSRFSSFQGRPVSRPPSFPGHPQAGGLKGHSNCSPVMISGIFLLPLHLGVQVYEDIGNNEDRIGGIASNVNLF